MSMNAFDRMLQAARQQQDKRPPKSSTKRPSSMQHSPGSGKRQRSLSGSLLVGTQECISTQHTDQMPAQPPNSQDPATPTSQAAAAAAAVAGWSPTGASALAAAPEASPRSQHAAAVAAFKRAFSSQRPATNQHYDYLLVIDLEATCNQEKSLAPVEIIELSCVIVDTKAAKITNNFQAYVKPTEHPQLDPFCIELTGIQQQQVDSAEGLQAVLQQFHSWLQEQGMFQQGVQFGVVTWTSWDMQIALCTECGWRHIQRPDYLCAWIDLKRYFTTIYKRGGNLRTCVEAAGLKWEGRAHSGLDDATNTAQLAIKLMSQGAVLEVTQRSENKPVKQQKQAAAGTLAAPAAEGAATSQHGSEGSSKAMAAGSRSRGGGLSKLRKQAAVRGVVGMFVGERWTGMCFCSVKAHLRTTKKPGVNHGRQFYSCGRWTITRQSGDCDLFIWEDDVNAGM